MNDRTAAIFRRRKLCVSSLEPYGFRYTGDQYIYQRILKESGFELTVTVTSQGDVTTTMMDPTWNEPYTLHEADGATGSFVGGVRTEYEEILTDIAENCFEPDVFKTAQARHLIAYVRNTYGDELEFLWQKFPDNAVWRRKDNGKWYGAILTVSRRKLRLPSDELVEIIDLRHIPEKLGELLDGKTYFPGWHMNKKNWYTMILDGSVPLKEICERIDESYRLANK